MRVDLHDDPAVFRLATMTMLDRFQVVGRLHAFWSWTDKHAVDGRVDGAAPHLIDTIVTHEGFADALMVVGWLSHDDRGLLIPNFERHNGRTAKERGLKNQRQARWREKDAVVDGATSTKPSTREEKRREDITASTPPGFCAFWNSYPSARRVGKGSCLRAWLKTGLESRSGAVVAHVEAMKRTPQWTKDAGKFAPTSLTYLNQKRYDDGQPESPEVTLKVAI
jgi:hypothetical protein